MFYVVRELISNPIYFIFITLILSVLFYSLFAQCLKIKKRTWKSLDFIWIAVGLFGFLSVVEENRNRFAQFESESLDAQFELNINQLKNTLQSSNNCPTFQYNPALFNLQEFDSLQTRQDSYCKWTELVLNQVENISISDKNKEFELPILYLDDKNDFYNYDYIIDLSSGLNQLKVQKQNIDYNFNSNFWNRYLNTTGLFFVVIAFSLRFAIALNNLFHES